MMRAVCGAFRNPGTFLDIHHIEQLLTASMVILVAVGSRAQISAWYKMMNARLTYRPDVMVIGSLSEGEMTAAVRFTAMVYNVICAFGSGRRSIGAEFNSACVQSPCSSPHARNEGRGPGHIAVHHHTWFGGRSRPFLPGQIDHSEGFRLYTEHKFFCNLEGGSVRQSQRPRGASFRIESEVGCSGFLQQLFGFLSCPLGIYSVGFASGAGAGLLGYSLFPWPYSSNPSNDGVVTFYSFVPSGTSSAHNFLTHKVG